MAGGKGGGQGGRGNKAGSHRKGAQAGSGGKNRRALRGAGKTKRAEDRPWHKSYAGTDIPEGTRLKAARDVANKVANGKAPRSAVAGRGRAGEDGRSTRPRYDTVIGRNPVLEAFSVRMPFKALYVAATGAGDEKVRESIQLAADLGVPILEASRAELDRLAGGDTQHQGVLLQVRAYQYQHPADLLEQLLSSDDTPLVVALDGVTDPRNLGAVVRSAAAFGAQGVIVPERRSAGVSPGTWKASAGAVARVPVARATNLTQTLKAYSKAGFTVVGLAAEGTVGVDDVAGFEVGGPLVVVVGSEGKGLSRLVADSCDLLLSIPMTAATESLNAGVAASITLYEVARRRRAG